MKQWTATLTHRLSQSRASVADPLAVVVFAAISLLTRAWSEENPDGSLLTQARSFYGAKSEQIYLIDKLLCRRAKKTDVFIQIEKERKQLGGEIRSRCIERERQCAYGEKRRGEERGGEERDTRSYLLSYFDISVDV